jgi:hypothetical protein
MAAVVHSLQLDVEQAEGMILKTELSQRKRVLKRLGYLEAEGVVTRKGHVRASCCNGAMLQLFIGLRLARVLLAAMVQWRN